MKLEDLNYKHIEFSRDERILTAALNRPEARNAVNGELHGELSRLFYDLANDDESDVIVLTGKGGAFCAGGDLKWLQAAIDDPVVFQRTATEARRILFGQLELDKPLIARLNGHATGLGASIALVCDMVFAAEEALIGDPHVSVGLAAGDGGCVIWPQLIGYARAKEFLFTGDLLKAPEAERIGLINRAVAADELDEVTYGMARRLAGGALQAIRWTKTTVNLPLRQIAQQVFDIGMAFENMSISTADHQEAINAFREKRAPVFKGK